MTQTGGSQLIDVFRYSGKRFLDLRQHSATVAELLATPETSIPDGFTKYCEETRCWYEWNSHNDETKDTGRWRKSVPIDETLAEDYIFAVVDSDDTLLFGIDRKGGSVVNSISGVCEVEQFDSNEYIYALMDSAGNMLYGVKRDGTFVASKFQLPADVMKQLQNRPGVCSEYETADNEFIYKITDIDGQIVFAVRWDGTSYIPKGIPDEQQNENRKINGRLSDLEKRLANFKGGTGDWSDSGSMRIAVPRMAIVYIHSSTMPTAKSGMGDSGVTCDIPCQWEFWDMSGNYAKIWVTMSCQGNSSMAFVKKNLAIDMFADSSLTTEYVMKFGDWVSQDSYHLKAYYTDAFRGVAVCSYQLFHEIMGTRSITDNAPYKEIFANGYEVVANDKTAEIDENFDTGALCHPMGFPVAVYQNGEFYGIYSWQIKKHRDNYHMSKKTAEHVHLDGTLTPDSIWGGKINWTYFEIRNPKSLLNVDGTKYDGDRPKEIMGDDADLYNDTDKDMKRCAKVKKYVEQLSGRVGEIESKETELGIATIEDELNRLTTNHSHTSSTGLNTLPSIAFIGRDEWLVYLTKDDTNANDRVLINWLNARYATANAVAGFSAKQITAIDTSHCVKVLDDNGELVESSVWQEVLTAAGLDGYALDFNGKSGRVYPTDRTISLAAPSAAYPYLKVVNVHNLISAMDEYLAECSATMRALIDKYFFVSHSIDYIIHAQITNNADGFNKNWQWTTWDGKRWAVNPYDLDMSFGGYFTGNFTTEPPTGWVGNTTATPIGWIIKYFLDDIKSRYNELRKRGLFEPERIARLVQEWVLRIGEDMYEQEYSKWPESPCHRDSKVNSRYWKRHEAYAVNAWSSTTVYADRGLCCKDGKVWQSVIADNLNNDPSEDDGTRWKEVGYNQAKVYAVGETCYYGPEDDSQYRFTCKEACAGQPPFTGFYANYPRELGYFDSPYRVLKWLEARVASVDNLLGYTE